MLCCQVVIKPNETYIIFLYVETILIDILLNGKRENCTLVAIIKCARVMHINAV